MAQNCLFLTNKDLNSNFYCHRDPEYHDTLSEASQGTLKNQGGPMTEEEAEAFEALPDFEALVALRKWDDGAKDVEIPTEDCSYYKELCRKVLSGA